MIIDYQCKTCDKLIPVDKSKLKVGDTVSFMTRTGTTTIRFSSKEGSIQEIKSDNTVVILSKKQIHVRSINDVNPAGVPSPLNYAWHGTCECSGADA